MSPAKSRLGTETQRATSVMNNIRVSDDEHHRAVRYTLRTAGRRGQPINVVGELAAALGLDLEAALEDRSSCPRCGGWIDPNNPCCGGAK